MLARAALLDEPVGSEQEAREQADRVGRRFVQYLDLLQPDGDEGGPEIEIEVEFEIEVEEGDVGDGDAEAAGSELPIVESIEGSDGMTPPGGPDSSAGSLLAGSADDSLLLDGIEPLVQEIDAAELSADQRRELLMAAARRLTATDDPTALSYVLTALVQVDLSSRQDLLEVPDTTRRLMRLDGLLARETFFLRQGLRPIIIDPGQLTQRST